MQTKQKSSGIKVAQKEDTKTIFLRFIFYQPDQQGTCLPAIIGAGQTLRLGHPLQRGGGTGSLDG